ncbi:helix-turn-helix domain-containing protein [Arcobacter porcinus]|uniref:Bacteriophage CI repressor helix-turn-helix domain protein n=1 Tax=Arcobacter porcinus TaxID=1935204 RepID=A0ABX2YBL4_9BACT|nr:helix-turn-helix domain-containing protein [Arcobacter porcinus]OCL90813.1 Bacteriophage CI repressor helix-turn-helix domain protein [Arcobacter porcinus]
MKTNKKKDMILNENFVNEVLDNLANILNVKSDRQLAIKLDILPSTLFNNRKRGILPYEKILTYALQNNLSLDDIFKPSNIKNNKVNECILASSDYDLVNINILNDSKNFIQIPLKIAEQENYKAYLDDKKIYVIDTINNNFKNKNRYLIKNNNNYFVVLISLDFENTYILRDENDSDLISKLTKEEFEKIEIIGKVDFILSRETYI